MENLKYINLFIIYLLFYIKKNLIRASVNKTYYQIFLHHLDILKIKKPLIFNQKNKKYKKDE
jgi:hypothetical protein